MRLLGVKEIKIGHNLRTTQLDFKAKGLVIKLAKQVELAMLNQRIIAKAVGGNEIRVFLASPFEELSRG